MKHDRKLMDLLLLEARDGDQKHAIARYPQDQVLEQTARLIEEGFADGKIIRDGLRIGWVKNFRLTAAGHRRLENVETVEMDAASSQGLPWSSNVRIFISHSSADEKLAEGLANLFERSLRLSSEAIRCTSVVGYSLPAGATIDDQLRLEIEQSPALVALITEASLSSTYVLFELGARWVLRKPMFPILAGGMKSSDLHEPLKGLVAATCDERGSLLNLIESLASILDIPAARATAYERALGSVLALAKALSQHPRANKKPARDNRLELGALEIVALQAVGNGCYGPLLAEEVANNAVVTIARARQAIESTRRKGLLSCQPLEHGDVHYVRTEQGSAWLAQNTRPEE
jgi:hypothetical protein